MWALGAWVGDLLGNSGGARLTSAPSLLGATAGRGKTQTERRKRYL